jgi:hypothetical protein
MYEGWLYKDCKIHSKGILTYAEGDKYEDESRADMRHGKCVYTNADGDKNT